MSLGEADPPRVVTLKIYGKITGNFTVITVITEAQKAIFTAFLTDRDFATRIASHFYPSFAFFCFPFLDNGRDS